MQGEKRRACALLIALALALALAGCGGGDSLMTPISVGILNFQGTYATNSTGILAAGSVLAVLPAILLFVVHQRFIVGAFVQGALKG
jgi:ABC-type maltose transport system permease subunit